MSQQNFYAYVRVSTQKQGEKGVSLQEQKDAIQRYSDRFGLTIAQWFEERETAAKRGRPIFNQMLKLITKGKAQGVIIHKIDRSARNLRDWADLGDMIDSGIRVHFANEDLDLTSRGGRLSADIQAVVASDFIRNLREETRKGQHGRLKQGLLPWRAPVGYLNNGPGKLKEPDPEKAPLVQKAFELYSSGQYTMKRLAEDMHSLGLTNCRGNKLTIEGLSAILTNPFYVRIIRIKTTGETFIGNHEPIITNDLFERAQAVREGRTNYQPPKHFLVFRRMLTCRPCKQSLIGELQKGRVYYRCHNRCPDASLREDYAEAQVLDQIQQLRFNDEERDVLNDLLQELRKNWHNEFQNQVNAISLRLGNIKERLGRLTDAYVDRLIEREIFHNRQAVLLVEQKTLEGRLAHFKAGDSSLPDQVAQVLELATSVHSEYQTASPEEKRDLLKTVTSNRWVDGKKLELMLAPPFDLIQKRFQNVEGRPEGESNSRMIVLQTIALPLGYPALIILYLIFNNFFCWPVFKNCSLLTASPLVLYTSCPNNCQGR